MSKSGIDGFWRKIVQLGNFFDCFLSQNISDMVEISFVKLAVIFVELSPN